MGAASPPPRPVSEGVDSAVEVDESLREFRRSLAGAVLVPGEAGYESARRCFNALVDRRPAVIARCVAADDVATAFDFARTHGLQVAVRGGGHNPAGHCVCDGGLVIDLSLMRGVDVDGDGAIARAEGGATWLDFDSATQAFGLVTPGGVVGSTGVAGLTLGGGHRPPDRAARADAATTSSAPSSSPPTGRWSARAPTRTPSCSGGSAEAAATSASRRGWSSAFIRSNRVLGGRLTYSGARRARGAPPLSRSRRPLAARSQLPGGALGRRVAGTDARSSHPATRARTATRGAAKRCARRRGSSTTASAYTAFLAQQHVFNPGYGDEPTTTGRATSCASSRTSCSMSCSGGWSRSAGRPARS